ncbi:MAG: TIGR01244 family sulfur transferase [Gammaproteobacteria bacterium]|nr:TIGR01244 family sulfur transferase [Gammaproteobacteria bacterium]
MAIISVTSTFGVAPQLLESDMVAVKALGYSTVINNRPDDEPGHPSSNKDLQAAAEAQGLKYIFVPVFGMNFPAETVAEVQSILDSHNKVLAFCRTGTRSINLWARAQPANIDVAKLVAPTGLKLAL